MTDDLPGALLEETFIPEDVVALPQLDGSVHLLMYVGKTESGGYLHLKYAVIQAPHAGMFAEPKPVPQQRPPQTAQEVEPRYADGAQYAGPPPPPDYLLDPGYESDFPPGTVGQQGDADHRHQPELPRTRFSDMPAPGLDDDEPPPYHAPRAPILDPDLLVSY